ncbi:hypothetical protein [Lentzea sp. NPDC055074]
MNEVARDEDWSFTVDEAGRAVPSGPSGTPENAVQGMEILFDPIGNLALAEYFLLKWREMRVEQGPKYSISTPSARVERLDEERVEVQDFYDQFEDFKMGAAEFERVLVRLVEFMKTPEFKEAQ